MRLLAIPVALALTATVFSPAGAQLEVAPYVRTVERAYGEGPVRVGGADELRIRFEARRGDRVRLAGTYHCPVSLTGPGGAKVSRLPSGFWRVASPGRQTFSLKRCAILDGSDRIQLEKLRVSSLVTNGEGTRLGASRGFVDAVGVKVPESGEVKVFAKNPMPPNAWAFEGLVLPDGTWYPRSHLNTYYFEAGRKISTPAGRLPSIVQRSSLVPAAGDKVLVLVDQPVTVWQSTAIPVATSVDGPVLSLPATRVPYREYQVEFDAVPGSYIHGEALWPTDDPHQTRLLRPDGGRQHLLEPTTTGRYRLMVATWARTGSTQVRVRTITEAAAPVPLDGSHVTLTADEPGEWVLAPMTLESDAFYRLSVHSVMASGRWGAVAMSHEPLRCGRWSGNGCGDWAFGTVTPEYLVSGAFGLSSGLANPWFVLLQPDPGVTASLELSVSRTTSSRVSRLVHRSAG